jgi:hypothetical protein
VNRGSDQEKEEISLCMRSKSISYDRLWTTTKTGQQKKRGAEEEEGIVDLVYFGLKLY